MTDTQFIEALRLFVTKIDKANTDTWYHGQPREILEIKDQQIVDLACMRAIRSLWEDVQRNQEKILSDRVAEQHRIERGDR